MEGSIVAVVLGVLLLAGSIVLVMWHVRAWRKHREQELNDTERGYYRRQFRRRTQVGVLVGILGTCLIAGYFVPMEKPNLFIMFWFGVMLLVFWIALLALADIVSTRLYASRMLRENSVEHARLKAELRKVQAALSNGHSHNGEGR